MDLMEFLKRAVNDHASDLFIVAGGPVSEKLENRLVPISEERLFPKETEELVQAVYATANRPMEISTSRNPSADSLSRRSRFSAIASRSSSIFPLSHSSLSMSCLIFQLSSQDALISSAFHYFIFASSQAAHLITQVAIHLIIHNPHFARITLRSRYPVFRLQFYLIPPAGHPLVFHSQPDAGRFS